MHKKPQKEAPLWRWERDWSLDARLAPTTLQTFFRFRQTSRDIFQEHQTNESFSKTGCQPKPSLLCYWHLAGERKRRFMPFQGYLCESEFNDRGWSLKSTRYPFFAPITATPTPAHICYIFAYKYMNYIHTVVHFDVWINKSVIDSENGMGESSPCSVQVCCIYFALICLRKS